MTDNLSVFNDREQRIAAMSFKEKLKKLRAGITFPPPFTYNEQKTIDGEFTYDGFTTNDGDSAGCLRADSEELGVLSGDSGAGQ